MIEKAKEDREDLIWWKDLLSNWNGVSFRHWEFLPNLFITSDASITKGLGIVYGSHWCSIKWPSASDGNLNIAVLELIPLVISAHLWGHEWSRKKILFRVDNMAVVNSVNSGLPKDLHLAFLVRLLNKLAVLYNFRCMQPDTYQENIMLLQTPSLVLMSPDLRDSCQMQTLKLQKFLMTSSCPLYLGNRSVTATFFPRHCLIDSTAFVISSFILIFETLSPCTVI